MLVFNFLISAAKIKAGISAQSALQQKIKKHLDTLAPETLDPNFLKFNINSALHKLCTGGSLNPDDILLISAGISLAHISPDMENRTTLNRTDQTATGFTEHGFNMETNFTAQAEAQDVPGRFGNYQIIIWDGYAVIFNYLFQGYLPSKDTNYALEDKRFPKAYCIQINPQTGALENIWHIAYYRDFERILPNGSAYAFGSTFCYSVDIQVQPTQTKEPQEVMLITVTPAPFSFHFSHSPNP